MTIEYDQLSELADKIIADIGVRLRRNSLLSYEDRRAITMIIVHRLEKKHHLTRFEKKIGKGCGEL
jgi:hypothetical protein